MNQPAHRSRSSRSAATVIAVVLAIAGIVVIVVAVRAQRSAPRPNASAAGTVSDTTTTAQSKIPAPRPTVATPRTTVGLPSSPPVSVSVPSIGVQSDLTDLGRNADGTVQVPDSFQTAGWYDGSVTPGQNGPSVLLGHVDSTAGPGVFFRLGALHPGDQVVVTRRDGTVVTFRITGVREYPKDHFPTIDVYGNTPMPTIRLVTCGGTFDNATHHYLSNIVAFGQLA
jgi:hypothetical protein